MKRKTTLIKLLALLAIIFIPLSKYIHKRDVLAFCLGALAMIISVRFMCNKEVVVETPIETVPVITEAPVIPRTPAVNTDAANIARVLYGVKEYHLSDDAKTAIIETIFSRAECSYGEFGDTVTEVCLKPQQWQGFAENSAYLREDYELALSYIEGDRSVRITPEGCYWFVVSENGVTVRTKFEGGNSWTIE